MLLNEVRLTILYWVYFITFFLDSPSSEDTGMATNVFNINEIFSGELVLGDLDVNEADSNDQQEEGNQQELGQPAEEQKLDDTANLDEDVLQVILTYLLLRFLRSLNWLLNFLLRSKTRDILCPKEKGTWQEGPIKEFRACQTLKMIVFFVY